MISCTSLSEFLKSDVSSLNFLIEILDLSFSFTLTLMLLNQSFQYLLFLIIEMNLYLHKCYQRVLTTTYSFQIVYRDEMPIVFY